MAENRSFLVLWKTAEAESCVGETPTGSVGSHMKGLVKGDRIFVCACDDKELFLLGAMKVLNLETARRGRYRGKPLAAGETLAGPFQMLPLGPLKWQLLFENTASTKLSTSKSLLWQVRSRRRLTSASSRLLLGALAKQRSQTQRQFAVEGRRLKRMVSTRERDPRLRAAALKAYDFTCSICDMKPSDFYGQFAVDCLDVHHLRPLGSGVARRSPTNLTDVIVVCPTCHRALHTFEEPAAWRRFRRECGF